MQLLVPVAKMKAKYGGRGPEIVRAIAAIGPVTDVAAASPAKIREKIAGLPASESVCLVGGYDVLPPFIRDNPTSHLSGDDDAKIPTDAPYGAMPGVVEDEYAPPRVVSRIPDSKSRDPDAFLRVLRFQAAAAGTKTPGGGFQQAASEFKGAARFVHRCLDRNGRGTMPSLSPPSRIDHPDPAPLLSGRGRVHVLLHGADFSPDWAFLYGKSDSTDYLEALSAPVIEQCKLAGSVVTFSSCYAAMLDGRPGRTWKDQVALACLASGAKVVLCSTRSNWIQTMAPFSGLGPGLVGTFWKELRKRGARAGLAFVNAKRNFLKSGLAEDENDHPYVLKTVLQAQLYGNPDAAL